PPPSPPPPTALVAEAVNISALTGLTCTPDSVFLAANDTTGDSTAFGTLYAYDSVGSGGSNCATTPVTSGNWAFVETEWAHAPTAGAGVAATLGVLAHSDGKFYLTVGATGCVAYHWLSNTAAAPVGAASQYWPAYAPDGSFITTTPTCA
ncbi:MAG: hypothetical protein ACKVI4_17710, partial [Actinomycetales bacterium]